jgi:lipid-A-disaccharide synthase
MAGLRIFLAAGESSGDQLGAHLMAALRRAAPGVSFSGVGGPCMQGEGLASLFPMSDLSVMGVSAVAGRLPLLLRRIRETAQAVLRERPAALVLIDAQDFSRRVAKIVRKADPTIPIITYVSPTIWAWRPGRARAMRPFVEEVLALLPFEPQAHRRLGGPPCTYVGHSLIEQVERFEPTPEDLTRRDARPAVVAILPGSRRAEVRRLMPVFGRALQRLQQHGVAFEPVLPAVPHLLAEIEQLAAGWPVRPAIVAGEQARWLAFRQARAALAASGTVTLELALARVPTVIAYRVSLVEEAIVNTAIRLPSFGLPNLILGEAAIPELMQRAATPGALAKALSPLFVDGPERAAQLDAFSRLRTMMEVGGARPSDRAAARVLHWAGQGRGR